MKNDGVQCRLPSLSDIIATPQECPIIGSSFQVIRNGHPDGMPLRILHINTERTWRGGENQLLLLARGLKARRHRQWIVGQPGSPLMERAKVEGIETIGIRMPSEWSLSAIYRLIRILLLLKIQVLHMHTSHAGTLGGIAGKWSGVKTNIISRRVDFSIRRNPFRKLKYQWGIDCIIAVSNGIREVLIQDGIRPDKITVVRDGIDLKRFDPGTPSGNFRAEIGINGATPVIGTIGHFADHKGHRYLVEAAEKVIGRIPGTRFILVGEGKLRKQIEEQVALLGLEKNFVFTGFRTDIPSIIAAFDLFVLPSHLEGLCTSLMDAMAMGKPVVATQTGGIPEVVKDGTTGLLVPPRDPEAIARAILHLLQDPDLRYRMGQAGRRRVIRHFSAEAMVDQTERLYYGLLDRSETQHVSEEN